MLVHLLPYALQSVCPVVTSETSADITVLPVTASKCRREIGRHQLRGVQVSDTKRGPKSPKFLPKIGLLRRDFGFSLPDTLRPSRNQTAGPNLDAQETLEEFFVPWIRERATVEGVSPL